MAYVPTCPTCYGHHTRLDGLEATPWLPPTPMIVDENGVPFRPRGETMTNALKEFAVKIPTPAPCSAYVDGVRCASPARVWLVEPAGKLNPGGYVCQEHGQAVVDEYASKLGEDWSLTPIERA